MYIRWFQYCSLILSFQMFPIISTKSFGAFIAPEQLDFLRHSNMKEFIKYLRIPHEGLCHANEDDDDAGTLPMFNEELAFGDLLIDEEPDEDDEIEEDRDNVVHDFNSDVRPSEKSDRKKKRKSKWKKGIIPYYISSDFSDEERKTIENAIDLMNSKLEKVQFRAYNRFTDDDYIHIFSGKGCYAKLGRSGGPQPLSLQASICLKTGIIQHELMHVLGFSHEQNRPDRDDYIEILYKNIPKKWRNEYQRKNPKDAAFVGKYDYYSVMHYPTVSPGDPDKLAMLVLDVSVNNSDIGNRPALSNSDVKKINKYYR